ncbi:MAG: adenylate/guanylate cyclase domain-containing protein [Anaerolineales bacterium]
MPGFLFTDIEGSTRLWEEHAQVMSAALERHNDILRAVVEKHGGEVVKSTGDGILALFDTGNPLECAIELQISLHQESWPEEIGELRIRIGIHAGEYEPRGGDIYGPDVNRAARVMDAAWGGQILITNDAKTTYKLPPEASLHDLGAHLLTDLIEPQSRTTCLSCRPPSSGGRTRSNPSAICCTTTPARWSPCTGRAGSVRPAWASKQASHSSNIILLGYISFPWRQ